VLLTTARARGSRRRAGGALLFEALFDALVDAGLTSVFVAAGSARATLPPALWHDAPLRGFYLQLRPDGVCMYASSARPETVHHALELAERAARHLG
jgi:hypothetical protein